MGLFDKLFSKKTETPPQNANIPSPLPKLSPYEEIEAAIARNPLSQAFRTDYADTANFSILEQDEFLFGDYQSYVCFDLETTGFSQSDDAIIEIAAVRVDHGMIKEKYQQLVNPGRPIPPKASSVNHITDDMVAGAPKIYEVLPDFLSFVGSDVLVAHNANFDSRFIAQACLRYRFRYPKKYFDSYSLKLFWPDLPDKKLSTFLSAAGIENPGAHRALDDAEALAKLMIVSLEKEFNLPLPENYEPGYSNDHYTGTVEAIDNKLSKKRFVLTGKMGDYERAEFEKIIMEHGGKCTQKSSAATDYLVMGSFPNLPQTYVSSAVISARKISQEGGKIQIISPDDVLKMLEES